MAQLFKKSIRSYNRIFYFWDYIILLCVFIVVIGLCGMLFLDKNYRAIYYMKTKNYEKSRELLLQALDHQPFSTLYRMNLALNYLLEGQYENSIQENQFVKDLVSKYNVQQSKHLSPRLKELSKSSDMRFAREAHKAELALDRSFKQGEDSHDVQDSNKRAMELRRNHFSFEGGFNSAVAASGLGDVHRALSFYQQALSYRPQSIEVKTNIELLTRQAKSKNKDQKQDQNQKQNQQQDKKQDQKRSAKDSENKQGKSDQQDSHNTQESNPSKNKEKQIDTSARPLLNKDQVEAVLKSIQEQEKNIKRKRDKEQQGKEMRGGKKDW